MKRRSVITRRLMQRRERLEYRKRRHPQPNPAWATSGQQRQSVLELLFNLTTRRKT